MNTQNNTRLGIVVKFEASHFLAFKYMYKDYEKKMRAL